MGFLNQDALARLGVRCGSGVAVSEKASLYNPAGIRLGSNVRIDDFCILSAGKGGITIGSNVHIAAYTALIGAGTITIDDFANLSARVSIYSSSDDYSGAAMTNPTVPDLYKNVDDRPVSIGRHAIIGCGAVVLPGSAIEEGAAVGALSLVTGPCAAFTVYAGVPARAIKPRKRDLLRLEAEYQRDRGD